VSGRADFESCGSGRTDAGVHALRQTAHLRLREPVEPGPFRDAVNESLPHDIQVLAVLRAADRFHARHDAVSRSYLYQVSRRRTGLAKPFVWWVRDRLDPERLAAAAALVTGRHDFRRFCERPGEQPSTVVVVEAAEIREAGDLILIRLVASHFLWKMVRRVVGTLVQGGTGGVSLEVIRALIDGDRDPAPDLQPARWTAPASGLFLERVIYPGEPPPGPLTPAFAVGGAVPAERLFVGSPGERPARRGPRSRRVPARGRRVTGSARGRRPG
jgi:tRNA pseudouridine38-40 synthase